jgi:hypothetical protein
MPPWCRAALWAALIGAGTVAGCAPTATNDPVQQEDVLGLMARPPQSLAAEQPEVVQPQLAIRSAAITMQAPTITCPADLTVECDGSGNAAQLQAWLAGATVVSTCPNLTVTNDFTALTDECGATGSATVTWTATDDCGTASCSATFRIVDTTPPVIAPPADKTVECDGAGNQPELQAWLASATATDACGTFTLTNDFTALSDDCGATGAATVTWTAKDECGNTSTASARFAIADTTPPTITPPADKTIECDGADHQAELQAWLASATATDACGTFTLTNDFTALSDDCGATGAATVTWTAKDECGNTSTASARFAIADTTPPTLTLNGPAEMMLECGVDEYTEPGAAATDVCDSNVMVVVGGDKVDTHVPGTYVVTYDAKDACGNAAPQLKRTVTVVDTIPPEVIVGDMKLLWPPNHKYQKLTLADCNVQVLDACAGELDVNAAGRILSIYSDEPEDATGEGDGHTTADIVLLGPSSFEVRVERQGGGNGRVYGIHFEVTDPAGNKTDAMCFVGVPHDQSGKPPIDDGPDAGYTVTP